MTKSVAVGFVAVAVLSANAAIWDFELQGRAGSGLLPQNEAPVQNSTLASGAATGPIQYDTTSHQLTFTIDFSNLSAPLAAAAIHGPADFTTGGSPQLYDLSLNYLNQPVNATSGTLQSPGISGTLTLQDNPNGSGYSIAQQETQLNGGLWYIEIASQGTYSMGEIRGNLVPVPEPAVYGLCAGLGLMGLTAVQRCRRLSAARHVGSAR